MSDCQSEPHVTFGCISPMAFKSKADKLAAAQAAAAQPLRVTDAEFALLKLRESFVKAQVMHASQPKKFGV